MCLRLAAWYGLGPRTEPLDPGVGLARLEEAEDVRAEKFEAIRLLADTATIKAASQWQHRVWRLQEFFTEPDESTEAEFLADYKSVGEAREAFYAATRGSLDVLDPQIEVRQEVKVSREESQVDATPRFYAFPRKPGIGL
mgnify:CR=1 FL=1